MRKGRQTDLPDALNSLSRRLDRKGGGRYLQLRIAAAWEAVAGPSVTSHTTRAHLRDGELVVYVDAPVWATELSALSGPYREALNKEMGETAVKSMRFAVSRKADVDHRASGAAEPQDGAARDAPKVIPLPLTDLERAQVEASAAGIPGEGLREAVVKATIAGMEWEKGRRAAAEPHTPPDGL